jgi:DNA repair photolyase
MIISASRRTDIPAYYSEWLVNRLRQGFALVRNPMNFHQVSRIGLSPASVECLVFWTKNPRAMMARLEEIAGLGYQFYFLFTLTGYDGSIEKNVPPLAKRIDTFQTLSARIGREKVIWRYDPILFTAGIPATFHSEVFASLAEKLAGYTDRCIVSFLQMYRKCERNMRSLMPASPPVAGQIALILTLRNIGMAHGITLQTCAQGGELGNELKRAGIPPAQCIDDNLIASIIGVQLTAGKDKNQRRECGCIESIDIGAYNSCPHHCLYCYANSDQASVERNCAAHLPDGPLLYGNLGEEDRITERLVKPLGKRQFRLF